MFNKDKKIKLQDMKPGIWYDAYDGNRKLPKQYMKSEQGVLFNREDKGPQQSARYDDDIGESSGCSWTPVKSSIRFKASNEELEKAAAPMKEFAKTDEVNFANMREGIIYRSKGGDLSGMLVTLLNGNLHRVTGSKQVGVEIQVPKLSVSEMFTPIGEVQETKLLNGTQVEQKVTFWESSKTVVKKLVDAVI